MLQTPQRPPRKTTNREEVTRYHKRNSPAPAREGECCLKSGWNCEVPNIVWTMLGPHESVERPQQLLRYVEDYLECVESLPLDIQRNVSVLREIDSKYQGNEWTRFLRGAACACTGHGRAPYCSLQSSSSSFLRLSCRGGAEPSRARRSRTSPNRAR